MESNRPFSEDTGNNLPAEVREYIAALEKVAALVPGLVEQVKMLSEKVEKLEARLNKNSGNSSKPPSSDPPWQGPRKTSAPGKIQKKTGRTKRPQGASPKP